jgi:hypothetical protein
VIGEKGNVLAGVTPGRLVRVPKGQLVPGSPQNVRGGYRGFDGTAWLYPVERLWVWNKRGFFEVRLPQEALSNRVGSLTTTSDGTLWVSISGSGEYRRNHGQWTFVPVLEQHPDWTANFAYTDSRDCVWLALRNYAAMLDRGRITIYSDKQGLDLGPLLAIAGNVDQLWVGGEKGLALLYHQRFRQIRGNGGTDFRFVTGMVATSNDGLWLTSTSGIVHISQQEVVAVLHNPEHLVNYEVFDFVSDLPRNLDSEGFVSNPIVQDEDGILWIETINGVARLDPAHIARNPIPPPVSIRSIVVDERRYSVHSEANLPPLIRQIRIDYDGLSLTIPERVKFRYRLLGLSDSWVDAGTRRQAFYTNLSPGRYKFEVVACNNSGMWASSPAVWHFEIQPAWYQSLWFHLLVFVALSLTTVVVFRMKVSRATEQIQRRLAVQMEERTRIARELHDTILHGFYGLLMRVQSAANRLPTD